MSCTRTLVVCGGRRTRALRAGGEPRDQREGGPGDVSGIRSGHLASRHGNVTSLTPHEATVRGKSRGLRGR